MIESPESTLDRVRVAMNEEVRLAETDSGENLKRLRALETLASAARSYLSFSEVTDARFEHTLLNLRAAIRFAEEIIGRPK